MAAALRDLKSYVMTDTGAANQAESTVLLMVTHSNLSARFMEIRFDRFMTVLRVKEKLMTHCGQGDSLAHFRAQLEDLRERVAHVRAQLEHPRDTSTG
jgi:tubulin-folding cofactor B